MKLKNLSCTISAAVAATLIMALFSSGASASETPIFRFNGENGLYPRAGLVADTGGNLYGVTEEGGNAVCQPMGCGVVFELSPNSSGGWTENVIYAFKGTSDAVAPVSNLIFDKNGNLYGATVGDYGSIFELTPGTGGTWTEKILFRFNSQAWYPTQQLAFDSSGNLYGSLLESDSDPTTYGAVFKLSPQSNGTWTETIIHQFAGGKNDGEEPDGGVVVDSKGNVFGVTELGGSGEYGTLYELSPNGSGSYTETILFNFDARNDGGYPAAPLLMDGSGNLYGGAGTGGTLGYGVIFEFSPSGSQWNETVLYNIGPPPDGGGPSGLVFDAAGDLYGTTIGGGSGCNYPGCGTVFRLTPQSGGTWKETILHNFESAGDGSVPGAGVILGAAGRIYGMTEFGGGRYGKGTVFEIQP